jgi:hypothetical protein
LHQPRLDAEALHVGHQRHHGHAHHAGDEAGNEADTDASTFQVGVHVQADVQQAELIDDRTPQHHERPVRPLRPTSHMVR